MYRIYFEEHVLDTGSGEGDVIRSLFMLTLGHAN